MIPVDECFSEDMTVRIPIIKTGEHQDSFTVNIIATDGTAEGISIALIVDSLQVFQVCVWSSEVVFGLMVTTELQWYFFIHCMCVGFMHVLHVYTSNALCDCGVLIKTTLAIHNYWTVAIKTSSTVCRFLDHCMIHINFIAENVDFRLRQTAVTFTPSDQVIDIEIDILKDNIIDTNELFSVSIEIPPDEPLRPRITIDTPSTVFINTSCDELPPRFPSCNVSAAPCDTDFAELQCIHSFPGPVVYR